MKSVDTFKIGDFVTYTIPSDTVVQWGDNDDPRGILEEDKEYIVENIDIHRYHTKIKIKGYDGWFNSVSFRLYKKPKLSYYRKKPIRVTAYQTDKEFIIHTLEGNMVASKDDFIITGVKGETYPCKPDIFHQTYEEVNESNAIEKQTLELTTTLNKIRKYKPCTTGWETLLRFLGKTNPDNKPLLLLTILEANGVRDAIWALRTIDTKYDNAVRLYACFCARYSLDIFEKEYPNEIRPRQAIETAERYAKGQTTKAVLASKRIAVYEAARGVVHNPVCWDTIWAAGEVANDITAWEAAWDASKYNVKFATEAFTNEFKRLCRLEDEYELVVKEK